MLSTNTTVGILLALMSANVAANTETTAQQCANCHGNNGASAESEIPIIGGLPVDYMISNLVAYRDKQRPCPQTKVRSGPRKGETTDMCSIAGELAEADIRAIADYFSGKAFVSAKQSFDATRASRGKQVHKVSCEKCHSEGGTESDEETGRLAGQWKPYLELTMKQFIKGERAMPKKMKRKIESLSAEDVDALVNFYISQQ